jgi:hypothetical protein
MGSRTLFRFPSNLAYSSRTSCSRGERLSLASRPEVEAERCSGASDAMLSLLVVDSPFDRCKRAVVKRCSGGWTGEMGLLRAENSDESFRV